MTASTLNDRQIAVNEALANLRKVYEETKHMEISEATKLRRRAVNKCWAVNAEPSRVWAIMTGQVGS